MDQQKLCSVMFLGITKIVTETVTAAQIRKGLRQAGFKDL
jgi:hypothetical protein